ncbi:ribonuclease HIII [Macrococcoides caseolyticum]|uniref:ribonuclease HIII n=1 Tax=Macrococcoides caseolyticum TaxID=69966 RepID=UPI001EEDD69A|nr:ribonuclease HIII [Macrococcus caseolyticus]MCE4956270.1 ribonuclease HIII [Macrococcus caseolyticus]
MSSNVYQLDEKTANKLISFLPGSDNYLPSGSKYRKKIEGQTVTVYNSNKFMVQGSASEAVALKLLGNAGIKIAGENSEKKKAINGNSIHYDAFNCIGSDEAGSGDYFGPMTVVASYVSKKNAEILKVLGVMDSKNINDDKIIELAEQIIPIIPHSLLVLDNPKYNERKAIGWSQVKMKAVLHNQAIINVLQKIDDAPLDYIVIDQFAVQGVYENYALTSIPERDKTRFETKGESKSIAIAASSIIARYAFVKYYDQIIRETGIHITKGAGAKVDLEAAKIIEKKGIDYLDSITKKDFKNRAKALALVNKRK